MNIHTRRSEILRSIKSSQPLPFRKEMKVLAVYIRGLDGLWRPDVGYTPAPDDYLTLMNVTIRSQAEMQAIDDASYWTRTVSTNVYL